MIRPATLDDAPAAARLLSTVYADEVLSARGLRHSWAASPARAKRQPWAADVRGELVGLAVAGLLWSTSEAGAAFARVTVHPDHRRRGIGTALWREVEAHLEAIGAGHVSAEGLDDDVARRFMAARGFRVFSVESTSGLDPRALSPPPPLPAGVELRPFTAFADPRAVYELAVETARDIPTEHPVDDIRWSEWLAGVWEHPDLDRDASLVALVDGEPASLTHVLADADSRRALSTLTGTSRRFRGRGLAYLVKHHALARAAARGITLAVTSNHDRNRAMLAVNRRLGYEPLANRATYARPGAFPPRLDPTRVRRVRTPLVSLSAVLGIALAAAPARPADSPYVPVTAAERKATRVLVDVVLAAHRRGEWWRVCAIASERMIRTTSGTRDRCRSLARRQPGPSCKACTYRVVQVLGVYRNAADRTRKRKTVVWGIAVKGDPGFRGESGLELRFVPERGGWALDAMLADGSAR